MKTANPFIPTVSLLTVPQRSRRERVKFAVFSVLGAHAFLLMALLVHGYQSDLAVRARSMAGVSDLPTFQSDALPSPDHPETAKAALAPKTPATAAVSAPAAVPAAPGPPSAATGSANSAAGRAELLYTVKSGDTLTQIARLHRTTVNSIRAANGLTTDRLAVGMKLKVP